jgi:hypothetical protein
MYRLIGLAHVRLMRAGQALRAGSGQGTVEYVALILLVALVMAGVVAAMKGFRTGEGAVLGRRRFQGVGSWSDPDDRGR